MLLTAAGSAAGRLVVGGGNALVRLAGDPPTFPQLHVASGQLQPAAVPAGHTAHDWAAGGWVRTTTATGGDFVSALLGSRRTFGLWRQPAGGPPVRLAPDTVEGLSPRPSPAGDRLAFFTDHGSHFQLRTLDLRTGERAVVTTPSATATTSPPTPGWRGHPTAGGWQTPEVWVTTAAGTERFPPRFFLVVCDADGGYGRRLADGAGPLADWR